MKRFLFYPILLVTHLFATMEYYPGNGKEELLGDGGTIRLLTWNILGLPNDRVAVRPWEDRIDGIAELILSTDAEIVILEECFEKGLSLGLYERLKDRYAHFYLHLEAEGTPLPSGLALFSKLPVAKFRFTPHLDLLDGERDSKMGTLDFFLMNREKAPIAHIAGSHFQGSSNCQWRIGLTEGNKRLSYEQVRAQETEAALKLFRSDGIPHYLCGDLNVDRRSTEFYTSRLNAQINPDLLDPMTPEVQMRGTNTSFSKHQKGLAKMYPSLSVEEIHSLALSYKKLAEDKMVIYLRKAPWQQTLSRFDPSYFSSLEEKLDLSSPDQKMIWDYFKATSLRVIASEKELWKKNKNRGEAPSVSIGRLLENRALPVEESLDYILGVNGPSIVTDLEILEGYDDQSIAKTLSDHQPIIARLRVAKND